MAQSDKVLAASEKRRRFRDAVLGAVSRSRLSRERPCFCAVAVMTLSEIVKPIAHEITVVGFVVACQSTLA